MRAVAKKAPGASLRVRNSPPSSWAAETLGTQQQAEGEHG